jgi:hypothetical protein
MSLTNLSDREKDRSGREEWLIENLEEDFTWGRRWRATRGVMHASIIVGMFNSMRGEMVM